MFEVKQYTQKQIQEWNEFIEDSRQGTFLFNRCYMDYHADRFQDASLMIYRKGQLYALLPANRLGDTLYSHQGLTYGGLITKKQLSINLHHGYTIAILPRKISMRLHMFVMRN